MRDSKGQIATNAAHSRNDTSSKLSKRHESQVISSV